MRKQKDRVRYRARQFVEKIPLPSQQELEFEQKKLKELERDLESGKELMYALHRFWCRP